MKKLAFVCGALVSSFVFATEIQLPSENMVEAKGVFKISANWVEDKGSKYDISLNLENLSDSGAIIFASSMECFRNNVRGELKYTFFNTGEKTIDFKPGEIKKNNYVCKLGSEQKAEEYKIVVKNVYANKSMDGKTVSEKPLIKELVWKQKFISGLPVVK